MDYDRLRDLQAKFDENPRRYFAPLANEYRKGGNPKRAIEICRAHLAQMPGHMSGMVVFGQALFEGAEFDEARTVFEGAIVLDPENLIALRLLGDLALQAGKTHEARTWYVRLLEADPKDTAVIALVEAIDAGGDGGLAIPSAAHGAAPPASQGDSTFTVDFSFVDKPGGAPAVEADPDLGDTTGADSAVEGLSAKTPEPESPLAHVASSSAQPESDSPLSRFVVGAEREDSPPDATLGLEGNYPADAAAPPSPAPEPFVNETMAQLYLQQGYRQLALRVYRQLSEAKPDDQSLKDRIAEIEAPQPAEPERAIARTRREQPPSVESPLPHGPGREPGSVETPGFDRQPVDSPGSTPSREPDSIESPVREDPRAHPEGIAARQPSMREFFATLGRRRPPRPPSQGAWGKNESSSGSSQPATGAAPSASLDAVFAGANVSSKDARAASALAGAFSASGRGTSPPPPTSTPTPRGNPRLQAQESEEDVAKFRAWLDGLTGE